MKKYLLSFCAALLFLCGSAAHGQAMAYSGFGPPQGNCFPGTIGIDRSTGLLYKCTTGGGWVSESSGSAFNGGVVTNPFTAPSIGTNGTAPSGLTVTPNGQIPTAPTNSIVYGVPLSVPVPYTFMPPTNVSSFTSTPGNMQCLYVSGMAYLQCSLAAATSGLPTQWAAGQFSGVYFGLGLNGTLAPASMIGIFADSTSADTSLYAAVGASGQFKVKVNNTVTIFSTPGVGIFAPIGTPADTDVCSQGQIEWDAGFIYVCAATNSWKRAALSTY